MENNKRYVYVGDKCEQHYNSCTDDDIKDKQDYVNLIFPKITKKNANGNLLTLKQRENTKIIS